MHFHFYLASFNFEGRFKFLSKCHAQFHLHTPIGQNTFKNQWVFMYFPTKCPPPLKKAHLTMDKTFKNHYTVEHFEKRQKKLPDQVQGRQQKFHTAPRNFEENPASIGVCR